MSRYVAVLIAVVAVLQLWLMRRYFGFLTGDDVEILAEAFRVARGFEYTPWDVRNLFIADVLIAPLIWLATRLGINDPRTLIEIATLPFIAASAVTTWLVWRLALRWTEDERASFVAAVLFAFHWIPLSFGSTVYPRTLATLCIVAAALVADRFPIVAGALAGFAFADRFSEIVFIVPLFVIARQRLRLLLGAALSITIAVGVYDWITWGTPFSSVMKFAHLTLIEPDFASRIKYQSPLWYLETLPRWCALTLLPLLWFARRQWKLLLFIAVPVAALSIIRHKELRYLQGVVPFLAIACAIGFARMNRRVAVALVAMSLLWSLNGMKYHRKKSMPAVMAARELGRDPKVHSVAVSQLWAFGDRLYLGDRKEAMDVGTPPVRLAEALPFGNAAAIYESDLTPDVLAILKSRGFVASKKFDDGPSRAVVVFVRR